MSYCRFSGDNWTSDVYVYHHVGGYVTHVAGNRIVGEVPKLPPIPSTMDEEARAAWLDVYTAQMDFLRDAERAPIDLPHAGESFDDETPGECADRLEQLRALGYHVPQYAIDELRAEAAEGTGG